MEPLEPKFEKRLKADPRARLRAIVRTAPQPAAHTSELEKHGLRVVRVSSLINAVTVEGTATAVLSLANETWVVRIEEDKPVHTL